MSGPLAQLRHLYALMVGGHVKDPAKAARGILGPAIESLEVSADEFEQLQTAFAASVPPNEALKRAVRR